MLKQLRKVDRISIERILLLPSMVMQKKKKKNSVIQFLQNVNGETVLISNTFLQSTFLYFADIS